MLGGLDPVIIFQFSKLVPNPATPAGGIPIVSAKPNTIDFPPIPIYLSETFFNIIIDGESKSVDIETDTQGLTNGAVPQVTQAPIQSSIEINIEGKKDSVALTLLSALVDQAFQRVTSQEYKISYLHGAITLFNAVLHSYAVENQAGTDKLQIKIVLSRGSSPTKSVPVPTVGSSTGPIPVGA